jgi:small conductance mechanosensitive channel
MTQFLSRILDRLRERFEPAALETEIASLVGNAVVAALTFVVYYVCWWVVSRVLGWMLRRLKADQTTSSFVQILVKVGILAAGAVAALSELGVNTPALVTSLGVAGLTIGFAARDALSNVVSGLFIYWDRPFVIGDLIEFGDHYGRVDRITLRATRVVTPDGKMLSIPNSSLLNDTVTSYTNFPNLRIDIPIQIGTQEDIPRTRQILLDVLSTDPDFLSEPPARVVVTDLGDFNVTVVLQAWVRDERRHVAKAAELREKAYHALTREGVEMPYETFAITPVTLRSGDG